MKPPIIYNESPDFSRRGTVIICNSVEVPLGHLEIVDIVNNEYIVYDSTGNLLNFEVYDDPKRKRQSVRIVAPETPIQVADVLRNILIEHLDYIIEAKRTRKKGFVESILALIGITFLADVKDREISTESLRAAKLGELIAIASELGLVE